MYLVHRLLLILFAAQVTSPSYAQVASATEESEMAGAFLKELVDSTSAYLKDMDPQQPGIVPRNFDHTHDVNPAYPLAYLYKTSHPANPYYRDAKIREAAIAIVDRIASNRLRPEWPFYSLCQVYEVLKDEISTARKELWKAYAGDYIETRGIQPYFYTAPNHEAFNALAIFRAGQLFGEVRWMEHGRRLMSQLIKMQSELGYFDEGSHHGPSMKYNGIQVAAMLLFYDYSKDPVVLEASKKLADFMIRYSFPDGSPISAFDGRQNFSFGYGGTLARGLDRWPIGKELNRRIYRTYRKWGLLDAQSPFYAPSDTGATGKCFWTLLQYLTLRPDAQSAPLPQDRDGYRMVERDRSFAGGVIRRHDWMIALSGISSDVPRYSRSVFQLERQSRLDVWHAKAGLIVGGGSNMVGADVPLANFLLLTGHRNVRADFGLFSDGGIQDRQATYFPRRVKTSVDLDRQVLEASFGHGDFSLSVRPLDRGHLEIGYEYDLLSVRQAFVQLPLILFHNSVVSVDGRACSQDVGTPVKREVQIKNPTTQMLVKILVSEGTDVFLRAAMYPLRWYELKEHTDQRFRPYYKIALLSTRVVPGSAKGSGRISVEVSAL